VPKGSGKAYDRESVDRQAKEHIEKQEREVTFAGLLLALAQESMTGAIKAGGERSIACTFQQRKDRKAPLRVVIRAGAEMFVFEFEFNDGESGTAARAS
jgi:hypothetical protein